MRALGVVRAACRGAALSAVLATAACGQAPSVSADIRISEALHNQTQGVSIFVLGPTRSDGIALTCDTLVLFNEAHIDPTDPKVAMLAHRDVVINVADPIQDATVDNVPSGLQRIVYIAAYDAADVLIGNGCTDQVQVRAGETVDVLVRVYPLPVI